MNVTMNLRVKNKLKPLFENKAKRSEELSRLIRNGHSIEEIKEAYHKMENARGQIDLVMAQMEQAEVMNKKMKAMFGTSSFKN